MGTLFEPPAFRTADPLNGQGGWMNTPPLDVAVVANPANTTARLAFGQQSLRISNAVVTGAFDNQTFSPPLVDGAGEPTSTNGGLAGGMRQSHYDATFRFLSFTPDEQPGLTINVSPVDGSHGRLSWLRISDQPAGISIEFEDYPTVEPGVDARKVQIATALDRAVAHSVRISIDFVPGASNDVVKVYVDDQLKITGTSWENYYRSISTSVPVVDQLLLRANTSPPDPDVVRGKGFLVDDVSIRSHRSRASAGPTGATGPIGPSGPTAAPGAFEVSAVSGTRIRVHILSAQLSRRTGVAAVRVRCPISAGLCSGSISLVNGRGVRVRRAYDLGSAQASTLRLRFATGRRTSTVHSRSTVRVIVFSRNQSGEAARVQVTLH